VRLEALDDNAASEHPAAIFRCHMELGAALAPSSAVVWTHHVPSAWIGRSQLDERSSVRGVLAGVERDASGSAVLILLAGRVAWRPDGQGRVAATLGRQVLGDLGMDVGLLDEVRHELPLTQQDRAPFYGLLQAVGKADPDELVRLARESLAAYYARWQKETAAAAAGKVGRQRTLIGRAVETAAAKGQFSVAPLFLDAQNQTGQLVLLEGIASRAIRIEASPGSPGQTAGTAPSKGEKGYFELEVFTSDSQNLPLVVCVPSLPPGFPLGDEIREQVRVAGFFLKKWRYDSRVPRKAAGGGPLVFQLTSAPLLIGAAPEWPLAEEASGHAAFGWLAGGVLAAMVLMACVIVWIWSRGDRKFRRRAGRASALRGAIGPPPDR
jgi:hypothetical protein